MAEIIQFPNPTSNVGPRIDDPIETSDFAIILAQEKYFRSITDYLSATNEMLLFILEKLAAQNER